MATLYEKVKAAQEQKRVKPFTPAKTAPKFAPLSSLIRSLPSTPTKAQRNLQTVLRDRDRGTTISQGTVDPIVEQRQSLSKVPGVGKFLTGTGPQAPSKSLYEPGSLSQSFVEGGTAGFLMEGFQKKINPTRKEVGEQIFTRYQKLEEAEPDPARRLELAIQDTLDAASDIPGESVNLQDLNKPGITLNKKEKDALFWTNTLEDTFAVLDSPIFVGSTKIPKNALLEFLAKSEKVEDITPRLRMVGVSEEVANEVAPKIAKASNEISIAKLIEDATEQTKATKKPSLFDKVKTAVVDKPPSKLAEQLPEARKITPEPVITSKPVKRMETKIVDGDAPFYRSEQGKFVEVPEKNVLPAPIREDLDTFIVKEGDNFTVIEARSGQVIGSPSPTIKEAMTSAKNTINNFGDTFEDVVSRAKLSPRYTQVDEIAPKTKDKPAIQKLFHGTSEASAKKIRKSGFTKARDIDTPTSKQTRETFGDVVFLTTNEAQAKTFAGTQRGGKSVVEVDSKLNLAKASDAIDGTLQSDTAKIHREKIEDLKDRGFDGLQKGNEVIVWNFEKLTPKIKGVTTADKIPEPKKLTKDELATEEQSYELLAESQEGSEFVTRVKTEEAEAVSDNLRAIFADMKGVELTDPKLKFTEGDLATIENEYDFIMDALIDDPARALTKYTNKFGELPEVTGTEFVTSKTGSGKRTKNSTFGRRGDDIVTELGFEDTDKAIEAFEKYVKRRDAAKEILSNLKNVRDGIRLAKGMDAFVGKNQKMLARELTTNRKALSNLVAAAEKAGFRRGFKTGEKKYQTLVDILRERRQRVRGLKWAYNLTDTELMKIRRQQTITSKGEKRFVDADPRFMTKEEFSTYMSDIEENAIDLQKRKQSQVIIKAIIEQKDLKKTENLREAMQLPSLSEMNLDELARYDKVLSKLAEGDELLTKRTLEVIDRTALKGAKTVRQVREFLAQEIKRTLGRDVKPSELNDLTAGALDYLRWDTALAESDPFFGFLVNKSQAHMMAGEANYLRIQDKVNELAKAASNSRKKTFAQKVKQKFIPTNERIIRYLEARGEEKEMFGKALTKEEKAYGDFMRNYYNSAYNYLSYINEVQGSRYIDAYFTHIRKGFLEKWSDDGFVDALKNVWDAQKEDMAIANIIDSDTGKILPKSKFFQFALKRTGEGEVSQNLTRVFLQYSKLMERKKMLDKMIPELDVYTQSLTPKQLTPKGLEMDRTLKEFVNNYLNNKRGRRFNYGGIVKQNGPADVLMRAGNTLVSIGDLGFNFLAGSAAMVGENVANFVALGTRGTLLGYKRRLWDTGMKRLYDPKAAAILKQAEPFIGRNLWTELMEVDKPVFEKGMQLMFGMFGQSSVEANKIYLLGRMTKSELKAGKISPERMAELKLDAGRWRDMGADVKSIVGATSPGAAYTKYKGWAIPIMRTTIKNIGEISSMLKKAEFKQALTAKQTKELMRELEVTTVALVVGSMLMAEDNDDGPLSKLRDRIKQESLTILGGIDPEVFLATPRLYSWLQQLAGNLKQIVQLEEYKTDSKYGDKGTLKGIGGIKQQFTPGFIRQFISKGGAKTTPTSRTKALDKLDSLDKLDDLDKLDNLDKLDRLDKLDAL